MLDLTEENVVASFAPIRPPGRNSWPLAVRAIEQANGVAPLIEALGRVLSPTAEQDPHMLREMLERDDLCKDLRMFLSQLGAARLLSLVDWLSISHPDPNQILLKLTRGETPEAAALNCALRTLTARATLTRVFSLDRIAEIQACAEIAATSTEDL